MKFLEQLGAFPFLNEPFIRSSFEPSTISTKIGAKYLADGKTMPIRAFGVMLMEIELRVPMHEEMERLPEFGGMDNKHDHSNHAYTAQMLFEDEERMESVPNPLKAVIGTCLKPPSISERPSMRLAIHSDIVTPIESMLKQLFGTPDTILLKPTVPALEYR